MNSEEWEESIRHERDHCPDCELLRKRTGQNYCKRHDIRMEETEQATRSTGSNRSDRQVSGHTVSQKKLDAALEALKVSNYYRIVKEETENTNKGVERTMSNVFSLRNLKYQNLNNAVNFCNNVLFKEGELLKPFIEAVIAKDYDMSNAQSSHIAEQICKFVDSNNTMKVKLYRSRNPWSKALGYYIASRPFDININTRMINRTTSSFVVTLVHELIHAIDGLDKVYSYGHGNNKPYGKQDTAPYYIGRLAGSFYTNDMPADSDSHRIKRRRRNCLF